MSKGVFMKFYNESKNEMKWFTDKWGEDLYKDLLYQFLFKRFTFEEFDNYLFTLKYFDIIKEYELMKTNIDPGCSSGIFPLTINDRDCGCKKLLKCMGLLNSISNWGTILEFLYQITITNKKVYVKSIYMIHKDS